MPTTQTRDTTTGHDAAFLGALVRFLVAANEADANHQESVARAFADVAFRAGLLDQDEAATGWLQSAEKDGETHVAVWTNGFVAWTFVAAPDVWCATGETLV